MKALYKGFNSKTTKLDKDFDINTTAEFGFIQPTLCEAVIPGSTYHMSSTTLCQVMPIRVPCLGRMKMKRYNMFVEASDIYHHWNEFISRRKDTHGSNSDVNSYIPYVVYEDIIATMFNLGCMYQVYYTASGNKIYPDQTHTSFSSFCPSVNVVYDQYYNTSSVLNKQMKGVLQVQHAAFADDYTVSRIYGPAPSINDADYVIKRGGKICCIRLSSRAKRFRKVIQGLGLKIDMNVFTGSGSPIKNRNISILPFLAYYKAWFDVMYPKRSNNFAESYAGKLVSYFDYRGDVTNILINYDSYDLYMGFVSDLCDMTYIYNHNYFTSQLLDLGSGLRSIDSDLQVGDSMGSVVETFHDIEPYSNVTDLTSLQIAILNAVNNNSFAQRLIGSRIQDWMRKLGVTINEESNFITSDSIPFNINPVVATSESETNYLGEKGGQSSAFNKDAKFKFTAKKHGYIIQFICIVPDGQFNQGCASHMFRVSPLDFYNQDYDGLGYTVTPMYEFMSSNSVANGDQSHTYDPSFGLKGRYNEYKQHAQNIVNGDFNLRTTRNDIGAFYLDRLLPENEMVDVLDDDGENSFEFDYGHYLQNSTALMKCDSNTYNFDRIFSAYYEQGLFTKYLKFYAPLSDHFVIQIVNDFKAFAPCKPISDSWNSTLLDSDEQSSTKSVEVA